MKLNVTQKILFGYVAGFILLLAFAGLTLLNGKKIEATTVILSQEKIPGLIAVSSLKSHVQAQTNQLYELYATNNQAAFDAQYLALGEAAKQDVVKLTALQEYQPFANSLASMQSKQIKLISEFVQIMKQPEVNWDAARDALSAFSKSANEMQIELDTLVSTVSAQTLARAKDSQRLTEQLISAVLVLTSLIFLGVLVMAYYSHAQVAKPLRAVSNALGDIANRRDLTYRLKQHNDDEVGDIAVSANHLLEEFQRLARTLDGTAQEVNRTTKNLTEITESTRIGMMDRNNKLRTAVQHFMRDIEASTQLNGVPKEIDADLHRAQMKFIQSHLTEIDDGRQVADKNVNALQISTAQLQKLAENMHNQIKLLNF